jgi:RNA polymerase sigma-70 factor (ECF subfamily)
LRASLNRDPELVRDPAAYLFGIAFNVISEREERANRNPVTYDSELVSKLEETLKYATSAEELEDDTALEKDIHAALMKLPRRYRDVILLCKRDGYSREEAARQLGLSPHTVEKYLSRARAQLAEHIWKTEKLGTGHGRQEGAEPGKNKRK